MPLITVTPYSSAAILAQATVGTGVHYVAGSASISSSNTLAYGTFSDMRNGGFVTGYIGGLLTVRGITGMDTGVIISTGKASEASGSASTTKSTDFTPAGVSGDDFSLTYQITCDNPLVVMPFVFGSEEYPEYVGLTFNDTLSVLFDGVEIAYVPGTTTKITINNVNDHTNSGYYAVFLGNGVSYDAAVMLNLVQYVVPGSTHTITLRVFDVGDGVLDSGLFFGPAFSTNIICTSTNAQIAAYFSALFPVAAQSEIDALVAAAIDAQQFCRLTPLSCIAGISPGVAATPQGCIASIPAE